MSALRVCLLGLVGLLGGASSALAAQSCPNPLGYDDAPPVRLTRPGLFAESGIARPRAIARSRAVPVFEYRPVDLTSWTVSATDCDGTDEDPPCANHRVYVPASSVTPREPLVVFLPGTKMRPSAHDLVLKTAAYAGYLTIGLSYNNDYNIALACRPAGELEACGIDDCYVDKRDEVVFGDVFEPDLPVSPADSILERLFALLSELHEEDMADGVNDRGWDAYFTEQAAPASIADSDIAWEKIIIAGFSQGASHAAYISQLLRVHGTFMIDGPGDMCEDANGDPAAANWMHGPDESFDRPRYGAMHAQTTDLLGLDPGEVPPTWEAMGLLADDLVNVDMIPDFRPGFLDPVPTTVPQGPLPDVPRKPGVVIGPSLPPPPPPAPAMSTAQEPADDGECLDITLGGLIDSGVSQKHGSMADDRCMPTTVDGEVLALQPNEAHLFEHYLKRFCYACDAETCP